MSALAGTGRLVRFAVRRDRVRIAAWVLGLAGLVEIAVGNVEQYYPTAADLARAAAAARASTSSLAFNGPAQGLGTTGGMVAFQLGAMALAIVGLMSVLMVNRLTRAEEEAGRWELVRSLPVGLRAPLAAAGAVVAGMDVALGVLVALALVGRGLPAAGAVTMGVCYALTGLVFAAVGLVTAQLSENSRVAAGMSGAVLGASFLVRAIGDVNGDGLSWASPIGWAQRARPFAGERWWPLLLPAAASAALAVAAVAFAGRRDLGAGLVAARPGRDAARPGLGHPLGLAIRLQRGAVLGWVAGAGVFGLGYGMSAAHADDMLLRNKALADVVARAGGATLSRAYLGTSFNLLALVCAAFAVASVLRLRAEEVALRAEPVLATPVPRWRWAAGHLAVAAAGSVVVLAVTGLGMGLGYRLAGGTGTSFGRLLVAPLVYAPPTWLLVGVATTIIGCAPRAAAAGWAVLGACIALAVVGPMLRLPRWALELSPFERVPQLPAQGFRLAPLLMITVLALALVAAGLTALRHRDIG